MVRVDAFLRRGGVARGTQALFSADLFPEEQPGAGVRLELGDVVENPSAGRGG